MRRSWRKRATWLATLLTVIAAAATAGAGERFLNQTLRVRSVDMGGGVSRAFYEYVPVEYVCNITVVFVFVPDNTQPGEFLASSGWRRVAEDESLAVVLVTPPDNGAWKVSSPSADLDYLDKVFSTINTRTAYYSARGPSGKYIIGYGEAASTMAQLFAFAHPIDFSGMAVVDGNDNPVLTGERLLSIGGTAHTVPYDGVKGKVTYTEPEENIPTPVWLLNAGPIRNVALVEHWKAKNKAYRIGKAEGSFAIGKTTLFENRMNPVHRVLLTESETAREYSYALASRIYGAFFQKARRWRFSPFLEFAEGFSVREMGLAEYDLKDVLAAGATKGLTYKNGPAYVKVPASYNANGPAVPLVLELHGVDNDPRVLAEQSGFWQVADAYGVIVVTPQAAPYAPPLMCNRWNANGDAAMNNDEAFLLDLLADVARKYKVDESRIYLTGFSNGGAMANRLSLLHADKFAAVVVYAAGKTEQATYDAAASAKPLRLPVWIFRGELDGNGANDSAVLAYWQGRQAAGVTASRQSVPGLYLTYYTDVYRLEQAEIRRTWVSEMAHTTTVEQSWMAWEQFFSRFRRHPDGSLGTP
jgi:poly(3-hydroxybutyrate) depolymerase